MGGIDVVDSVIEDRAGAAVRTLGRAQHQSRLAALIESEPGRGVEQVGETEDAAVKGLGPLEVADDDRDLGDPIRVDGHDLASFIQLC
jgi:hypothetical protein